MDRIGPEIFAADVTARDELGELLSRKHAAWIERAPTTEAWLIELGSIDAVQAKGLAGHLERVGILDARWPRHLFGCGVDNTECSDRKGSKEIATHGLHGPMGDRHPC